MRLARPRAVATSSHQADSWLRMLECPACFGNIRQAVYLAKLCTASAVHLCNLGPRDRYDGTMLWDVRGVPGVHELVWVLNFISFYFLYPSTFNILEVCIQRI
jgi:uncharacterized membrane protein